MNYHQAMVTLAQGRDLALADMQELMGEMISGVYNSAQIAAFFMLIKMKPETRDELQGAGLAVRKSVNPKIIDDENLVICCRTGCEKLGALDIAIASSFAASAAGSRVLVYQGGHKPHKAIGEAFLKAVSIKTGLNESQLMGCLEHCGLAFHYEGGLPVNFADTESLGVASMAGLLSMLAAPLGAGRYFVGVDQSDKCKPIAELFALLGAKRVMVVHSQGLDAIGLSSPTQVTEWHQGELKEYSVSPDDFGLQTTSLTGLSQDSAEEAVLLIKDALGNRRGHYAEKAADMIMLNAGAVIYLSGVADTFRQGVSMAREVVANTLAGEKIRSLAAFTQVL